MYCTVCRPTQYPALWDGVTRAGHLAGVSVFDLVVAQRTRICRVADQFLIVLVVWAMSRGQGTFKFRRKAVTSSVPPVFKP